MTYPIRDALERIELPSEVLARLVPRPEDAARWRLCAGTSETDYPDPLRFRRLAQYPRRRCWRDLANGRKWGERSEYLALFRCDPERAKFRMLVELRRHGGRIRATARALGCSTNTVYAVIRRLKTV